MTDLTRCPICRREIPAGAEAARCRPFCSTRCRTIDLGGWLDARYHISSALDEEEADAPTVIEGEKEDS